LPTAQQFICKKCTALSNVMTFEKPGILPVAGLIR